MTTRRARSLGDNDVALRERLISTGLEPRLADVLADMPHKLLHVEPRRPFREAGVARDEVMFVRSGLLAKVKTDSGGKRQIVALRFPGDGILPREGATDYSVQAIIRSDVMVGKASDFEQLIDRHPELARFFWKLVQRHNSIGYEWLVNTGRRDSTARVAHLLCETATRMELDVDHESLVNPFTQQHIADITGQTSVNVNRVFAELEKLGMIDRKGREIAFTDWKELRRLAGFQPAYLE